MKTFTSPHFHSCFLLLLLGWSSALHAQTTNYQWATSTGDTGYEQAEEVAVDASGNVITVGYFQKTVDFDPDPNNQVILDVGNTTNTNAFVQKQDADGNLLWAFSLGDASSFVQCFGVAVDAAGNIHVAGRFLNTVDFDPDPNVTLTASSANWDAFVIKVDPTGDLLWARNWGGALQGFTRNITLDDSGNVYTCGWFKSTTDFDPGAGTFAVSPSGNASGYIHKMDAAGNFQWVYTMQAIGGSNATIDQFAIKWDPNGYIISTGYFNSTIDFDGGSGVVAMTPPGGSSDIFVQKITTNGDHVWAKQLGGSDSDFGFDMAVDTTGNIYT